MADFKDLVQKRRSHRKFSEQEIDGEDVRLILRAALMAPTSKSTRAWHFIVVEDKDKLEKLSACKDMGGQFLAGAPLAIIVTGSEAENDCWIEDGAIAAISMQYQAEDLGLGSCWSQIRNRGLKEQGLSATQVIGGIVDLPEGHEVLCIVGIGHATDERKPQNDDRLKWENVHVD